MAGDVYNSKGHGQSPRTRTYRGQRDYSVSASQPARKALEPGRAPGPSARLGQSTVAFQALRSRFLQPAADLILILLRQWRCMLLGASSFQQFEAGPGPWRLTDGSSWPKGEGRRCRNRAIARRLERRKGSSSMADGPVVWTLVFLIASAFLAVQEQRPKGGRI